MNISFNWLKQYVNLPDSVSAEEVAEKLKLATVEVEGVERLDALLQNVVVGKVVSAEKHPQADKLKLCQVNVGNENLQIVCGGSNVRAGMLVALAKVGAKVKWHGEGEPVTLEPAKIRNVESFGMICGAAEIGLDSMFPPADDHEIVDLTDAVAEKTVGKPLAEVLNLNDAILEIDNKSLSNRPDLWGHYGLAREVAALFGKSLKEYKTKVIKAPKSDKILKVEVKDAKLCPRYMAVMLGHVKVGESPSWLKQSLTAAGLRPINNIVDITNYIMMDLGEPMHAFDAKRLTIDNEQLTKIVVRKAEKGEILTLLDGNKIELSDEDLVIADSKQPLAVAGVMGGEMSGINERTETIIFEAANFNAASIRRSSVRLGVRTDSSARFEKSLDPTWCESALRRAAELTLLTSPGAKVLSAVHDEKNYTIATGPIIVDKNNFEKKLGVAIPEKQIEKILEHLGFEITNKGDKWSIKIPTWRATKDVSIPEDLVEEVARIWGYDKITSVLPEMSIAAPKQNKLRDLEHRLRDILTRDFGYSECDNYAFVSREQKENLGDGREYLELDNPLSKEKPLLRRSLLPNLTENVVKNIEYFDTIKIFEIGKIFTPELPGARTDLKGDELLPRQDAALTACVAAKKNQNPVAEARRALERIAEELNLNLEVRTPEKFEHWQHPGRTADVFADGESIGAIYELHPSTAKKSGLEIRLGVLELNLNSLLEKVLAAPVAQYKKVAQFPEVTRDIAFVADDKFTHAKIISVLKEIDPLVVGVELFDLYQGVNLPAGKKSLAYHITLAHSELTLAADEIDEAMDKITAALKKLGAEIRT